MPKRAHIGCLISLCLFSALLLPGLPFGEARLSRTALPFGLTHLESDPVKPRVFLSGDFWLYAGVGVVKSTADGVTGIITRAVVGGSTSDY